MPKNNRSKRLWIWLAVIAGSFAALGGGDQSFDGAIDVATTRVHRAEHVIEHHNGS